MLGNRTATYGTSCEAMLEEHVEIRPIWQAYPDDDEQFYILGYKLV